VIVHHQVHIDFTPPPIELCKEHGRYRAAKNLAKHLEAAQKRSLICLAFIGCVSHCETSRETQRKREKKSNKTKKREA
jgi:hypothetical protein